MRLLSLLAAALGGGAALSACHDQVSTFVTPQGDCPADTPIGGEPCGAPAVCGYPSADCAQSFVCRDGVWQQAGDDCPPPPPAGSCPTALPGTGAPCHGAGQSCTFDVPGTCPGVFVATCTDSGWSVADQSPPCDPHPCPATEPTAGTSCDDPYDCSYTVIPPGCPPQTENATCVNGAWTIDVPAGCGP